MDTQKKKRECLLSYDICIKTWIKKGELILETSDKVYMEHLDGVKIFNSVLILLFKVVKILMLNYSKSFTYVSPFVVMLVQSPTKVMSVFLKSTGFVIN